MSVLIRNLALLSALTAVACGATTTNPPITNPTPPVTETPPTSYPPATVPQTSRGPGTTAPGGPIEVNSSSRGQVPAGQEIDIRLQMSLSSETAAVEQRFEGATVVDVMQSGRVLIPAGSTIRGVVSGVKKAGRIDRTGSLTLSFDQLIVNGREYGIRGTATNVFESRGIRDEAGTAGVGAGAGAVLGGLLGGVKGAVLGAVIGAGGAIAATDGKDVELPAGSMIRIRFDSPVSVG